jgi:hypothetical protein
MDRRQYLGLTGAGIAALLGGCSSSDGGGSSDEGSTPTYTDTPFRNETGTPTPVGTPTPKITGTPTTTPTATATPTSTPEPGKVLQQKAADLGLSIRAVRWLDQEQTPDEEYGLNDSQIDHILNAEPGMQLERAVEILEPEEYSGSVGGTFNTPSKTLTDQVAKDLRKIFQNDLDRYNTVYPQSRVFIYRGLGSHGVYGVNESNLSAAHPKDKIFDEGHVSNSEELAAIINNLEDPSQFSRTERRMASSFTPKVDYQGVDLVPTYVLEDSESVITDHEDAGPAGFKGLHEAYGQNIPPIDQGQREDLIIQMSESGLKILDYKFMPTSSEQKTTVKDPLPYLSLADAIYEQTEFDPYSEEGIPSDLGFKIGSKSGNKNFSVEPEDVEDIDFGQMPASI